MTTNDIREEIFDATGRLKLYFVPSSCYGPPQKGKKNQIEMFYFYSCLNKGALPGSQCSGDKPGCFSRELGAEAPQARMEEVTLSAHPILAGFSKYKGRGWNLDRERVISVFCAVCVNEGLYI